MTEVRMCIPIDNAAVNMYFTRLVGRFFKILPMFEEKEQTVHVYMRSLQMELAGISSIIDVLRDSDNFITLMSILDTLTDESLTKDDVKREVFRAIKICNYMSDQYGKDGVDEHTKHDAV